MIKARETLKKKAKANLNVTKGTKSSQTVLKKGNPVDVTSKTNPHKEAIVGMNKGITKNMDNYESLRADVWLSIPCNNDIGDVSNAFKGISDILDEILEEVVAEYVD